MSLVKPPLVDAQPGQPITAQGWNVLVDGLSGLYDAVLALAGSTLSVTVLDPSGNNFAGAMVIAVPASDGTPPAGALPPYPGVTTYTLSGLSAGSWSILVSADGYVAPATPVTIPGQTAVTISLGTAVVMPDLYTVGAQDAVNTLSGLSITVDVILDVTGTQVPTVNMPPVSQNAPVLMQQPAAGTILDPNLQHARLLIAAALLPEPIVTMPSLIGLSYDEAASVLNRLGLIVGTTSIEGTS
jgi:beta-lactam-binding protein with PASTA domain